MSKVFTTVLAVPVSIFGLGMLAGFAFCVGVSTVGYAAIAERFGFN